MIIALVLEALLENQMSKKENEMNWLVTEETRYVAFWNRWKTAYDIFQVKIWKIFTTCDSKFASLFNWAEGFRTIKPSSNMTRRSFTSFALVLYFLVILNLQQMKSHAFISTKTVRTIPLFGWYTVHPSSSVFNENHDNHHPWSSMAKTYTKQYLSQIVVVVSTVLRNNWIVGLRFKDW